MAQKASVPISTERVTGFTNEIIDGRAENGSTASRSHEIPASAPNAATVAPFVPGAEDASLPATTPPSRQAASSADSTSAWPKSNTKEAAGSVNSRYSVVGEPSGRKEMSGAVKTSSQPEIRVVAKLAATAPGRMRLKPSFAGQRRPRQAERSRRLPRKIRASSTATPTVVNRVSPSGPPEPPTTSAATKTSPTPIQPADL